MTIGPQSNLSAPSGYASSDLVFNDSFSGTSLDSSWNPYITDNNARGWPWNSNGSGGSGPGGTYDADYDTSGQISVNGGLSLTAIRQSINGINSGVHQTYPITSGYVSSYHRFEYNGGYLQISMRAPGGGGAWPALWMLPGSSAGGVGDNFEIDLQEGGFTSGSNVNHNMAWHLHTPSGTYGGVVNTGIDLTAGYNTYGLDWVPGRSITWYLNGVQIAQVTSAQATIPNEPMEVLVGNQVANSNASGWHTILDSSTPNSTQMQIGDVQLYQHSGSGDTAMGGNVTGIRGPLMYDPGPVATGAAIGPQIIHDSGPQGLLGPNIAPTVSHFDMGQLLNHPDFKPTATTLGDAGLTRDVGAANGPVATAKDLLLNQFMAGDPGYGSGFGQSMTAPPGSSQQLEPFLAKALH
jgi:beta-glucanase (GH16 family)